MSTAKISAYQKMSFEEATRVLYYHFSTRAHLFQEMMEDLMSNSEEPYKSITPRWYDEYKQFLEDNKNSK